MKAIHPQNEIMMLYTLVHLAFSFTAFRKFQNSNNKKKLVLETDDVSLK